MSSLTLEIITPSKIIFNDLVESVTVPGTKGTFQVFKDHAPIISSLGIGKLKIKRNDGTYLILATSGGTIEVNRNKILILSDTIEKADQIDVDRAKASAERAKKRLEEKNSSIDIPRAKIALTKALNRISIAELVLSEE